ncbi:hypothetical protein H4R20_004255 [Coemansia guatemalensis]|uniref:Major facilitator superfamily (MFS) profile domain-containing protein n=1 Tax=Coemansia guatemalensis TaxID=2761395 RepID=A0A9W8I088_9FUNG|nr:hypothetical protein H4R20_004255 [Coemansia guatemalensis]
MSRSENRREVSVQSLDGRDSVERETPLPWDQLVPLIAVRLAEPINYALILPFVYQMVQGFDVAKSSKDVSLYVGVLMASFSVCQMITTMFWGPLSDRIGRRPALLIGLAGDLATFVLFGLSKSFTWALVARSLNGFCAGNGAVVKSVIAELADDSNRSRMMALLPLIYNVGMAFGAATGGLLADPVRQYPRAFGNWQVFRTFPYLLPCLVGSLTTSIGLVVGMLQLKETLVITPEPENDVDENTPLLSPRPNVMHPKSTMALLTPTFRRLLSGNWLAGLAFIVGQQVYPIFAATKPSDGGLGFGTRSIGFSLSVSGIAILYLQLVVYPRLERKHGALKCYQMGLRIMTPYFFVLPWLSMLASHIERTVGGSDAILALALPESWISHAGFEYCLLWTLLVVLVVFQLVGDILAFTSINLLVANIAPSRATLGASNSLQQLITSLNRLIGPLAAGSVWSWSIKHELPYPFNSHLIWVICGTLMFFSWRLSLRLPSSVDVFASGRTRQASNSA